HAPRSANDQCKTLFPPEATRMPPQAQRISEQRNEDKKHSDPDYDPCEHWIVHGRSPSSLVDHLIRLPKSDWSRCSAWLRRGGRTRRRTAGRTRRLRDRWRRRRGGLLLRPALQILSLAAVPH